MKSIWKIQNSTRNFMLRKSFWHKKKIINKPNFDFNKILTQQNLSKNKKKKYNQIFINKPSKIKLWNKQFKIMDYFLNVNLSVYNGLKFIEFEVKKEMLGSTVGTYILTRRITSEIHLKKKIKKKKINK